MRYTAGYIITLSTEDKHNVEDVLMERIKPQKQTHYKNDIIVDGNSDIMYSLAKCCKPIKGDEIVGFITRGEGVSVHKKNCPNAKKRSERLIKVEWNKDGDNLYNTDLTLEISNSNYLVVIVNEAAKEKIGISEIKNKEVNNKIICSITIKVKDKRH